MCAFILLICRRFHISDPAVMHCDSARTADLMLPSCHDGRTGITNAYDVREHESIQKLQKNISTLVIVN